MSYDAKENYKRFLFMKGCQKRVEELCSNIHGWSLDRFLRNTRPEKFVDGLCTWATTREGSKYWQSLQTEWVNALNYKTEFPERTCNSIW